ncbi:plasmid pRiA4b ORF-3 family protein [Kitasatospora sp. NPDC050543]|uniref:plasmid pRiA4b ORF-3 family protein n=1 Tax=Kitasatospora sp. NPDC050543 TaxID=3364054 RepID=UPI00379D4967
MPLVGDDFPDLTAVGRLDQAKLRLPASGLVDPQVRHRRRVLRQRSLGRGRERGVRHRPRHLEVARGLHHRPSAVGDRFPDRGTQPRRQPRPRWDRRQRLADRELGIRSAAARRLDQVAPSVGDRFGYTYDFGDDWEHDILVEAVTGAEPGIAYPRCLTGRRACPPEDCGGMWGYEYLIEILADPAHEEHDERLEWLGLDTADQFDPAAFDLAEINSTLSGFAAILTEN